MYDRKSLNIMVSSPALAMLMLMALLIGSGCQSNGPGEKDISSEVINNPASAEGKTNPGILPEITFEKDEHDFGRLMQGETVTYGFKFRNTGKSDLLISSVSSSCGCTVTDYPSDPIPAGNEGVIQVTFKSEGRRGFQNKTVTVMANTQPNTKVLRVRCEIRTPGE